MDPEEQCTGSEARPITIKNTALDSERFQDLEDVWERI
jgi:hypothetical protein